MRCRWNVLSKTVHVCAVSITVLLSRTTFTGSGTVSLCLADGTGAETRSGVARTAGSPAFAQVLGLLRADSGPEGLRFGEHVVKNEKTQPTLKHPEGCKDRNSVTK